MHEKICLLVTAIAGKTEKLRKLLINNNLSTLMGVFKGEFLFD
jgi:hypothetical protein